jgi:uncharacterized protein (DUF302 family)
MEKLGMFRLAALLVPFLMVGGVHAAGPDGVVSYAVEGAFADVRQDLADAIINRGYVIDYEAKIGDMLKRTAGDVGAEKTLYANAEAMQFCSAVVSRRAMEADPANIAFCPYVLFVYERADQSGTVNVGFRQMPEGGSDASREALAAVNTLLDEIAREAAGQ